MKIDDPLKAFSKIFDPDERRRFIVGTLIEEHADLASMQLQNNVPADVQQLFETAKNISLYSWFVFRFHPVAESVAFSALEMALNLRKIGQSRLPPDHRSPGLKRLLSNALSDGWISEERFPSREAYVYEAAHEQKLVEHFSTGTKDGEISAPSKAELNKFRTELSLTKYLLKLWPEVRNALAHGSPRLTPMSRKTLRLISEAINQLFQEALPADTA